MKEGLLIVDEAVDISAVVRSGRAGELGGGGGMCSLTRGRRFFAVGWPGRGREVDEADFCLEERKFRLERGSGEKAGSA